MRAAVMQGLHKPLVIETVADPVPGAGEVVVKVGRCGICGSDLHMTEDPAYGQGAGSILGHEFAGEVVELGKSVEGLVKGDLVAVSPLKSCGTCRACLAGNVSWCDRFGLQGGGYAEYALTLPNQCVKLPKSASLADGAIIEPLAVALHGVAMAGLRIGDKVLILGAGPIGLATAFWARRMGAGRVVVQDVATWQQERALADSMRRRAIIGDPQSVAARLHTLARDAAADEVIVSLNIPDAAQRRDTLKLVMDAVRAQEAREVALV